MIVSLTVSVLRLPFPHLSRSAAVCLAQALLKCAVPKRLGQGSGRDHLGHVDGSGSPGLKEALVAWLLMSDQSDESDDSVKPHPIICR